MKFDRKSFFSCFRAYHKAERNKSLSQSQVDGLTFLLDAIEQDPAWKIIEQVSYFLATCAHETAWTFKPIKEIRGKTLTAAQKKYWNTGYYGRGLIQITWPANYKNAGSKLSIDLVGDPDRALEPQTAYEIAARGMREGWFTGKKLVHYINPAITDYKNARRIVNGTDKASHIADIAQNIEKCLRSSVAEPDKVDRSGDKGGESGEAQPPTSPKTETPTVETETVKVPQAEPPKAEEPKVSGFKTQWAALTTFLTASAGSIITWLSGVSGQIIIGFVVVVTIIGVVYMITRYLKLQKAEARAHDEKMQREKFAYELTVLQMKSAMSKTDNTVVVVPRPLQSSDS